MNSSRRITTIALRFSDNFAPDEGTINYHKEVINELGYVWYGKLGAAVSDKVIDKIMQNPIPKILLIHSGKLDRYWAYISDVSKKEPEKAGIPAYYRNMSEKFKTWFRITRIENAPRDILSKCYVQSSHAMLSEASRQSMNPYFIIEVEEYE